MDDGVVGCQAICSLYKAKEENHAISPTLIIDPCSKDEFRRLIFEIRLRSDEDRKGKGESNEETNETNGDKVVEPREELLGAAADVVDKRKQDIDSRIHKELYPAVVESCP